MHSMNHDDEFPAKGRDLEGRHTIQTAEKVTSSRFLTWTGSVGHFTFPIAFLIRCDRLVCNDCNVLCDISDLEGASINMQPYVE